MTSLRTVRRAALITAICGASVGWNSETPRSIPGNSAAPPPRDARSAARKILPDPLLLDGSAHPVEKKPDYGMIGDFELPGDENAQANRVGGPQNGKPPAGAAGKQGQAPQGQPLQGLPGLGGGGQQSAAGGAEGIPPISVGGASGGGPGAPPSNGGLVGGGQAGGVGQPNTAGNPNAAGNSIAGGGEAGGQPVGIQVAELGGAAGAGGNAGGGDPAGRPPRVTIGDKAMRIESAGVSPSTIGAKPQLPDGHIQQHKETGTGGKPPTSPQGPGRIEKGRTIPAGL